MAERNTTADRGTEATGIIAGIGALMEGAFMRVINAAKAIMADGTIAAAGRQGLDEIGAALKAFPDSIQVQESGTIWNPTQGEIGLNRELPGYTRRSYSSLTPPASSEAAENNRHQSLLDHEHGNGHDAGMSM